MISKDGENLAFVRDDHGRGILMVQSRRGSEGTVPVAVTPPSINVYEATFSGRQAFAVSGVESGNPPQIYLTDQNHTNTPLYLGESRYPALSPDGHWLAYSHFDHGVWNLWLRDQKTEATRRVADLPCNQIEPKWESDSKTLVYATDCGRSLWQTGISIRHVIP
jgi:Tol biopolymer transport system component